MAFSNNLSRSSYFCDLASLLSSSAWGPRLDIVPWLIKLFLFLEDHFSFLNCFYGLSFCWLVADAPVHIFASCGDVSELSVLSFERSGSDPRNRIVFSLHIIFAYFFINEGSIIFKPKFHWIWNWNLHFLFALYNLLRAIVFREIRMS